jgi:hypothetical protein
MNIFVLNTGRCSSTTFIYACSHITNYSCAHESRSGMLGEDRLDYPKNHIEADNRLSWFLGRLDKKYGDDALYIHLKRNKNDTSRSYAKRFWYGIMKAYKNGILMGAPKKIDFMSVALDYYETVNSNIDLFLKDKSKKITINLENIDEGFLEFWNLINAQGDLGAALAEFNTRYNATKESKADKKKIFFRIIAKLKRALIEFPKYIKNV